MSRGGAKRKKQLINPDDLHPSMAPGLTQGVPAKEALAAFPVQAQGGVKTLQHMTHEKPSGIRGVPRPHFHAENASTGFLRRSGDRVMGDTNLTFTDDVMRSLRAGMICMRCLEPQTTAFGDEHLEGCEGVLLRGLHYMRDYQILDLAMEFEGNKHLGPSKPMQEFMDEQDERIEKRKFIKSVFEGGQGKIPQAWLRDATLFG